MLLKCKRCGNTEEFLVFPNEYLYVTIGDGEIEVSEDEMDYAGSPFPFGSVICDGCGYNEVEIAPDFPEKFWKACAKAAGEA